MLLTIAATGTAILAAVMSILSPIYVSKLIDSITKTLAQSHSSTNLTGNAGILLGISLANALLTAIYIKLIGDLGERIAGEMRVELFEKLLHETVAFFDDNQVGELLTRLTVDVQNFKHSLKQILTNGDSCGRAIICKCHSNVFVVAIIDDEYWGKFAAYFRGWKCIWTVLAYFIQ